MRTWLDAWREKIAETGYAPWLILALAVFLRFFLLGIKPPHFDEGINGWFVDQMVKNGFYRYDPTNYHGPLHFYVLFLSQTLLGRNIWALRLPVVVISCACVWLTLKFETVVGRTVSRVAALAMAVSPAFVFYGRYSIHEAWMLFFSMLFIFGGLSLWKFGTRNYLWCTGMGLAGMILTKETYIIHVVCAIAAAATVWISIPLGKLYGKKQRSFSILLLSCLFLTFFAPWVKATQGSISGLQARFVVPHGAWLLLFPLVIGVAIVWSVTKKDNRLISGIAAAASLFALAWVGDALMTGTDDKLAFGGYLNLFVSVCLLLLALIPADTRLVNAEPAPQLWDHLDLAMVVGCGAALIVFFYSGTFFHWSGLKGLYQAYIPWFATGNEGHGHEKPWFYWLKLLAPSFDFSRADCLGYELPALAGLVLSLFALRLTNLTLRYLAIYGVGTFVVYTYVHYKTPWCIISVIWPFLFLFGAMAMFVPSTYKKVVTNLSAALLSISFCSMIWLNYFHCTTDTEPYVYVQTYNDIDKLTKPLLSLAHRDPIFYQLTGHIIRTSAYPLPWILGDFARIGYYEHNNGPTNFDGDFLLVQEDRIKEVEGKLHQSYFTEPLRIRPYQDTSKLYFNAQIFRGFFPGRTPDFVGKPSG